MVKFFSEIFYILGRYKKKLPAAILLFLLLSILDILSIGLMIPYVSLLGGGFQESAIFDKYGDIFSVNRQDQIVFFSVLLLVVFLIRLYFVYHVNKIIFLFGNGLLVQIREQLMMYYQYMSYSNFVAINSSDSINTIVALASKTNSVIVSLLRMISEVMIGFAIVLLLFLTDPLMITLLIMLLLIASWVYDSFFKNKIYNYGKAEDEAGEKVFRGVRESLNGLVDIRIFGKESYFLNMVKDGVIIGVLNNLKANLIQIMPRYMLEFFIMSFIVLFVVFNINLGRNINDFLPTIVVFSVASIRLMPIISNISNTILMFRGSNYAVHKVYKDLSRYNHNDKTQMEEKNDIESFESLKFNEICFSYDECEGAPLALHDVSMEIHANETIGIIGESGSGKTTLLNIILGLLRPKSGTIKYNNLPLDSVINEWRNTVSYIPQQVFLMDNTLKCNIALGEYEADIDESKVLNALEKANLLEFSVSLKDGINTYIGESGIRLSGGQRQRIALARSFYFERDILIMDEATSALDNKTERKIIDEVRRMECKKTVIIIAHRLNTVKHCDRIYRMKDGRIIDTGSYKEVVENRGDKFR